MLFCNNLKQGLLPLVFSSSVIFKLLKKKSFSKKYFSSNSKTVGELIANIKISDIYYFLLHFSIFICFLLLYKHEMTLNSISEQLNLFNNSLNIINTKLNAIIEILNSPTKSVSNSQSLFQPSLISATIKQIFDLNYLSSNSIQFFKILGSMVLYQISNKIIFLTLECLNSGSIFENIKKFFGL